MTNTKNKQSEEMASLKEDVRLLREKTKLEYVKLKQISLNLELEFLELEKVKIAIKKSNADLDRLKSESNHYINTLRPNKEAQSLKHELDLATHTLKPSCANLLDGYKSWFLILLLGKINFQVYNQKDKLLMKNHYTDFKYRTAIISLILPLINLIFDFGGLYRLIHHMWIVYLYLSLSLRENILCANGSKIKPWWIYHHYISAAVAFITITIPQTVKGEGMYRKVQMLILLQGVVMFFQYLYQSRRHYVRVATGKVKPHDVALSETLDEVPKRRRCLILLVPLLFGSYVFEIYMGLCLSVFSATQLGLNIHVFLVGFLLLVMGLGNAYTLVSVLNSKRKRL